MGLVETGQGRLHRLRPPWALADRETGPGDTLRVTLESPGAGDVRASDPLPNSWDAPAVCGRLTPLRRCVITSGAGPPEPPRARAGFAARRDQASWPVDNIA